MSGDRNETIADVITDVIERLAFMFGESADLDEMPLEIQDGLTAELTFTGHRDGSLQLMAPRLFCAELAANILGVEEEDIDDSAAEDAFGELLNILCGNLLSKLAGPEPIFDLTPPQVGPTESTQWREMLETPDALKFLVEDQPFVLRLRAEGLL